MAVLAISAIGDARARARAGGLGTAAFLDEPVALERLRGLAYQLARAGSEESGRARRELARGGSGGSEADSTQGGSMQAHEPRRSGDYLTDPEFLPPRILLAEDDAEMRALVSGDLRRAGYGVVECADGAALLQRLDSAGRTDGLGVDLVVADVRMPELTGLEVLERLREADPFTPYIVVTAFGSSETRRVARRLGAIAVLDKPFEIRDLLRLVEEAIGAPSRMPG